MGIFRTIRRWFKGNTGKVNEELVNTPEYWQGLIEEKRETLSDINERYLKVSGQLKLKRDRLATAKTSHKMLVATANEAKEQYKESQSEKDKDNARRAFNKMHEMQKKIEFLEKEISSYEDLYNQIKAIKDNATDIISDAESKAEMLKAKIEYGKTVESLTAGLSDINIGEFEGEDSVDLNFYKNQTKLEGLDIDLNQKVSGKENDFNDFLNN